VRSLLLVLAAAAVGVAAGLALLARGDELPPADPEGAPGAAIRARTAIEPSLALFGEPVDAEAELLVDPGKVIPSSVRLEAAVRPFTQVAATRTEEAAGDLVRIRYRFRLACTTLECLPGDSSRELALEPARLLYVRRAPDGEDVPDVRSQDTVTWPAFTVATRVGPFDPEQARWRADLASLPELTRRSSPAVLGAALLGGSALLALAGVLLLGSQLRRRRVAEAVEDEAPRATALERALAGVVSANGTGEDRRRSLERLARELSSSGRSELAGRARRLAWSPRAAGRPDVDALAADVRAVIEEER
jgi:hypothetical protein